MTPLSDIQQVRFIEEGGIYGAIMLVINRPGVTTLAVDPTLTLELVKGAPAADPDSYSPYNTDDYALSKKLVSINGRRAMDDISLSFRDSLGYNGTVNGVTQSENFLSVYNTFFGVWFSDVVDEYTVNPYRAWVLYQAEPTVALPSPPTDMVGGWIDPTYAPLTDCECYNPGTSSQILLGTRTIKITALSQAQSSITWGNILAPYDAINNPSVPSTYTGITASDCQEGASYGGFYTYPPGAMKSNTRADPFSSSGGSYYQAVPYIDLGGGQNPTLVGLSPAVWPTNPWPANASETGISLLDAGFFTGIHGYAVGDTGTITGGLPLAVYQIVEIDAGTGGVYFIRLRILNSDDSGYAVGSYATSVLTGGGDGTLIARVRKIGTAGVWGPSGNVFITVGALFAKLCAAQGLNTFDPSTDLVSALGFFLQKYGANFSFPVDTTPLPLDELYVSLNVWAQSHPLDGSLWGNPVGFGTDTPVASLITGLCNFLLANFNEIFVTSGTTPPVGSSSLVLSAMGTLANSLPAPFATGEWRPILAAPEQNEPNAGPRLVNCTNRGGLSPTIQCPYGLQGDVSSVEIPISLHRMGITGGAVNGGASLDTESVTWDSSLVATDMAKCFQVAWNNPDGSGAVINPDCWKGLSGLYWFDSAGTAAVYPPNWNPFPKFDGSAGSWAGVFYAVNCCFKSGETPPANLQGVKNGDDYFNSVCYHAVAFAALTLPLPVVQTFNYNGVSDADGYIQTIAASMSGQWRYLANGTQDWSALQIDQLLKAGASQIKWQAVSGANHFPEMVGTLNYASITGGNNSGGGGGTNSGGVPGNSGAAIQVQSLTITSNENDYPVNPGTELLILATAAAYSITGITNGTAGRILIVKNAAASANAITFAPNSGASLAANRFDQQAILRPGGNLTLFHDGTLWCVSSSH